ncbi:MAG: hypothetical protein IKJ28_03680, partial [Alphaproteobacteria bacterium]|nr:hypothetical protein [Alphaproteobacteria bacterium]
GVNVKGVEEEAQKACPKRYIVGTWGNSSWSALCGVAGTTVADKPLARYDGQCYACNYNDGVYQEAIYSQYKCLSVCKNERSNGSVNHCYPKCPKLEGEEPKPIIDANGTCHDCYYNQAVSPDAINGECSTVCPNRKMENGYCVLKDCPAGKPLKNKDGKCYSCEEEVGVNVKGVEEEAQKACPKRYIVGTWGNSSWSALCGVTGTTVANKPLARYDGQCYACNYNEGVYQEAIYSIYRCSNICGNRTLNVNSCIRDYCSEIAPLEDKNGICHPCNEPLPIDVGGDETKCSCINRTLDGQYCVLNGSSI